MQNILSLGIDVAGFDEGKKKVLNEFIDIFNKLDKYDGKNISPILGGGLLELNNSIKQTNQLLTELNTKITSLSTVTNTATGSTKKAASAQKELNAEQAKQKVLLAESNKALLDQAKAQNDSVQARLRAKQALQDQRKEEKRIEAERKASDKAQIEQGKQLAAQDKKDKADRIKNEKDLERAIRQRTASQKASDKANLDESRANSKLMNDYDQLKQAQKDQAINYSNLYIAKGGNKHDPSVKAALLEFEQTSNVLSNVDNQLSKVSAGASSFGRGLGQAFGQLRTLAYILPGLGIAGIFNLAFEAISSATASLGLFSDKQSALSKRNAETNKTLAEQISIFEELVKLRKDFNQNFSEDFSGKNYSSTVLQNKKDIETASSRGLSQDIIAQKELENSLKRLDQAGRIVQPRNDGVPIKSKLDDIKRYSEGQLSIIQRANAEMQRLNELSSKERVGFSKDKVEDYSGEKISIEKITTLIEEQKSISDLAKASYDVSTSKLKEYYESVQEFEAKKAETIKFNEDEARKVRVEGIKNQVSLNLDKNERLLSDEIASENKRAKALKSIRDSQKKNAGNELYNVTENISSTPGDKSVARSASNAANIKAEREYLENLRILREEYRQRRLSAQLEIDKSEINSAAIRDEKLANNENRSLEERLKALNDYINARQKLQDLEYLKDIDQRKFKSEDPTSKIELDSLNKQRIEQRSNIQADVESKVYDIVYTSTQKKLKLILDENALEDDLNKGAYTRALNGLNKKFKDQEISYARYNRERKKIDRDFAEYSLDLTIADDKVQLERLKGHLREQVALMVDASKEVESSEINLNFVKSEGIDDQAAVKRYDEAIGFFNGYKKSVINGEREVTKSKKELEEDEFKRAQLKYEKDLKLRQQYFQAARQIEQALYESIKQMVDKNFDNKIAVIENERRVTSEQYDNNIRAVEKSSLTQKDKIALDIRLNAEKAASDKALQAEQKRLVHDKAVFDRDIAIAHIILSTASAVASLIEIPPLAIAAGIAGAAQLAVAVGTMIPAYAQGTENHPGGYALFGEDGAEVVKEPYKSPYIVMTETMANLPKGTQVIPIKDNPELGGSENKDAADWDKFIWLAKQIKKNTHQVKNNFSPVIKIDLGYENHKRKILGI